MSEIPPLLQKWYKEKRWELLAMTFRLMSEARSTYYLRSQRGAVDAVKREFERLTGLKCYGDRSVHLYWDSMIGRYCHVLGAKKLIDDMRLALNSYKPRSIVYFLYRTDGKISRWDQLIMVEVERRAEKDRQIINADAKSILSQIRERLHGKSA